MFVKEELYMRHIVSYVLFGCDRLEMESIDHVMFYYKYDARVVWSTCIFFNMIQESPQSSFSTKLLWFASKVDKKVLKILKALV